MLAQKIFQLAQPEWATQAYLLPRKTKLCKSTLIAEDKALYRKVSLTICRAKMNYFINFDMATILLTLNASSEYQQMKIEKLNLYKISRISFYRL